MAKAARLRWLGHLYRCEKTNPCKKPTFTKPEGVEKRGRPAVRWVDTVKQNVRTLGKNIALDRNRWRA
jgi:hypothetical protein